VRLVLTEGQTHEMKVAHQLIDGLLDANIIGDRAYDAASLSDQIERQGGVIVIPSNPTRAQLRSIDTALYRERCLVEHFFQKIKRHRRVAMRFEKLARNFLAFVQLAAILVWLR